MKIFMIILDGAGDRPLSILDNTTPLEYAKTPGLDGLACRGSMAYISVINETIIPESDSGTMSLLSYNPVVYYPGRGTLEGLGAGFISNSKYSASFRVNFASYSAESKRLDRRTARDITDDELQYLANELRINITSKIEKEIRFHLVAFGHHRGIISITSDTIPLSGNVSNTDPGFIRKNNFNYPVSSFEQKPLACKALDDTVAAKNTAKIINEISQYANETLANSIINYKREKVGKLPANYLIFRDGGSNPKDMPLFYEKFNWSLAIYGQLPSEKAIADLIGARFHYTKALELQLDDTYLRKLASDINNDPSEVVYIHLKGPDEPGHDGKPFEKVKAIETIDKFFISSLVSQIRENDIIIVTCDHSTPCELGLHSTDNVPLLIVAPWTHQKKGQRFTEKCAKAGNLEINYGYEVLEYIKRNVLNEN